MCLKVGTQWGTPFSDKFIYKDLLKEIQVAWLQVWAHLQVLSSKTRVLVGSLSVFVLDLDATIRKTDRL